jgi:hypothetical protein
VEVLSKREYIAPQGLQESWYGILAPQGVKAKAPVYVSPPAPPIPEEPEPSVQTVTTVNEWTGSPRRAIIRIGGYYYFFYRRIADGYLCYKSSQWGESWGSEVAVTTASISGDDEFSVFEDGSYIWVVYATGTPNGANQNAITIKTRKGTGSGGTISFGSEVTVRNCGCCTAYAFAKSTNRVYLAGRIFNVSGTQRYYVYVWYTTDGSSWTEILASTSMVESGYACGIDAVYDPANTDGLMIVTAKRTPNKYTYKVYNGSSWGSDTDFAEKYSSNYINRGFSLARYGSEIHFIYTEREVAGWVRYRYYTGGSWSGSTDIEASGAIDPIVSAHNGKLYAFYIMSGDIDYKSMVYATHTWDGSRTVLQASENNPAKAQSDRYPDSTSIGVGWRTQASSPYTLRFKWVKLP